MRSLEEGLGPFEPVPDFSEELLSAGDPQAGAPGSYLLAHSSPNTAIAPGPKRPKWWQRRIVVVLGAVVSGAALVAAGFAVGRNVASSQKPTVVQTLEQHRPTLEKGRHGVQFSDIWNPPAPVKLDAGVEWLTTAPGTPAERYGSAWFVRSTSSGSVTLHNVNGLEPETLADAESVQAADVPESRAQQVSPTLAHILFEVVRPAASSVEQLAQRLGRHSYLFDAYLWDVQARALVRGPDGGIVFARDARYAGFTPLGNLVMHVDHALWTVGLASGSRDRVLVASDEAPNMYSGVPDWVYEEEVLSDRKALWLSPAGGGAEYMAFLRLNDSAVATVDIAFSGGRGDPDAPNAPASYPQSRRIHYPKAGHANPVVEVWVATVGNSSKGEATRVDLGQVAEAAAVGFDVIVTECVWLSGAPSPSLLVRVMSRDQNEQRVIVASAPDWRGRTIRTLSTADGAWYETLQPVTAHHALAPGYIELREDMNGWQHVCFYASPSARECRFVTRGAFDVVRIDAVRSFNSNVQVVFTATMVASTMRHVYAVTFDPADPKSVAAVHRLTPLLGALEPDMTGDPFLQALNTTRALFNGAPLPEGLTLDMTPLSDLGVYRVDGASADASHLALCYAGPGVPFCGVLHLENVAFPANEPLAAVRNSSAETWVPLESNEDARRVYQQDRELPGRVIGQLSLPPTYGTRRVMVNVQLTVPRGWSPGKSPSALPLVMRCYGGPGSQLVSHAFAAPGFDDYAVGADALGGAALVAVVDNRGTGFRGRAFRSAVAGRLGKLESFDQTSAAQWFAAQPWVDARRIALWGWSFGGYLTLKTVAEAPVGLFRAAISVAPVTDWRYYDSVYTERYLGLPQQRQAAYDAAAALAVDAGKPQRTAATFFGSNGTRVLLMHGLADDNVHFQNTEAVVEQLISGTSIVTDDPAQFRLENFRMVAFPNDDHSISTQPLARPFLYENLFEWLSRSFAISP